MHAVAERLRDELVDGEGRPADPDVVDAAVGTAADNLADAPIQEFRSLLVEHQALDELRQQGLHRDLDGVDAPESAPSPTDSADQPRA